VYIYYIQFAGNVNTSQKTHKRRRQKPAALVGVSLKDLENRSKINGLQGAGKVL